LVLPKSVNQTDAFGEHLTDVDEEHDANLLLALFGSSRSNLDFREPSSARSQRTRRAEAITSFQSPGRRSDTLPDTT
jgi:hypothetical protein